MDASRVAQHCVLEGVEAVDQRYSGALFELFLSVVVSSDF